MDAETRHDLFFSALYRSRSLLICHAIQLSHSLLKEKGVGFLPGSDFYFPATNLGIRVASVDFNGKEVRDKWPGSKLSDTQINEFFPNLVMGCDRIEEYLQKL